jgi:hypothetical protein
MRGSTKVNNPFVNNQVLEQIEHKFISSENGLPITRLHFKM